MTPTEKQYRKIVGKMFYSFKSKTLLIPISLDKNYGVWRYNLEYLRENKRSSFVTAIRAKEHIAVGNWIPAAEYIKLREASTKT